MKEYREVVKTRRRLRWVKEEYTTKKRVHQKKKPLEQVWLDRAEELRASLMTDHRICSLQMVEKRVQWVYMDPRFKEIIELGKKIRNKEMVAYFTFACYVVFSMILCGLFSWAFHSLLFCLGILPLAALGMFILYPKIRFKKMYELVFMQICCYCAGVYKTNDPIRFVVRKNVKNWDDVRAVNKKIIANSFDILSGNTKARVEKMIVRNYLTTYRVRRGNIDVGRALTTVFSGYNVDLDYEPIKQDYDPDNNIEYAFINKNTLINADILNEKEEERLCRIRIKMGSLRENWSFYEREDCILSNKQVRELEKCIYSLSHALGAFNIYIKNDGAKMMLDVRTEKIGLKEDVFQGQLKYPDHIDYDCLYSLVKTMYLVYAIKKIVGILYGPRVVFCGQYQGQKKDKIKKKKGSGFNEKSKKEDRVAKPVKKQTS